jgi:hypothetical protein
MAEGARSPQMKHRGAKVTIFVLWLVLAILLYMSIVYYGGSTRSSITRSKTETKASTVRYRIAPVSLFFSARSNRFGLGAGLKTATVPSKWMWPIYSKVLPLLFVRDVSRAQILSGASATKPAPQDRAELSSFKWARWPVLFSSAGPRVRFAPLSVPLNFILWILSVTPYLIMLWVFSLLSFKLQNEKLEIVVPSGCRLPASLDYIAIASEVRVIWRSEEARLSQAIERGGDYAHLFGLIASAIVSASVLLYVERVTALQITKLAVTVGVASIVAFGLELGRIVTRLSIGDASPRMFATATKGFCGTVLSGLFLSLLFTFTGETKLSSTLLGCALLGAAIAIVGDRALDYVSGRAATLLTVKTPTPGQIADLQSINDLTNTDVARLAEEGIESIHGLAYCPTPRLFFNTVYGLQRICDLQDQALLIELVGRDRAQNFRQHLLARGATDAQRIADLLLDRSLEPEKGVPIHSLLGFATADLCSLALSELRDDKLIAQMRVYKESVVKRAA